MSKRNAILSFLILILILFSPLLNILVPAVENIEIFDISNEKVVKVLPLTNKIEKEIIGYLYNITGMYPKFNPVPDKGFAVKVFLEPPVTIKNQLFNSTVDQVIIMFPEGDSPFLVVFQNEDNLTCYNFKGKTNKLLKKLNYKVNPK